MACILKLPQINSKGIISITTPEEREIRASALLLKKLKILKNQYVTCLHYNWHNFDATPDDLFDVHFAGKDDIIVTNGKKINLFEFDACNFTKSNFTISSNEKHWDILYVARAVFFKGIPEFLNTIRKLYDDGKMIRVLFICPMPPKGDSNKTTLYNLRQTYEEMFSQEEQDLFNLLIIKDRYPFFFDRETLAHFYKSSKIFIHTAPDERRCRVAAYAWCCGLPVIGKENVASILPEHLRTTPAFHLVKEETEYYQKIVELLEKPATVDYLEYQNYLSEKYVVEKMKSYFRDLFEENKNIFSGNFFSENLDIRLGRHHIDSVEGPNNINMSLTRLFDILSDAELTNQIEMQNDPERFLEKLYSKNKSISLNRFIGFFKSQD